MTGIFFALIIPVWVVLSFLAGFGWAFGRAWGDHRRRQAVLDECDAFSAAMDADAERHRQLLDAILRQERIQ